MNINPAPLPQTGATSERWDSLPNPQKIALLEAYNRYLDNQPPTCSMQTKQRQFAHWLARRGIAYP